MDDTASSHNQPSGDRHPHILVEGCQRLGIELNEEQVAQFERYFDELRRWNTKFNLTAILEYEDVQKKHYLDCLAGLSILAEELGQNPLISQPLRLVDVGTGAGFPGVPLKIAAPALKLTLMDGTGKKVQFLRHIATELQLSDTTVVQGRAEELGRQDAYRGQFDIVTARAVAPLNTLAEYLLPLVRRSGLAMIYKGASAPEEFMQARKAIEILGGETVRLAPINVPFLEEKRYILLVKKIRRTPNTYPRSQGLARKKPLA